MLKNLEIGEHDVKDRQSELKEKVETTLHRLQKLKERVAELKRKCEELRTLESTRIENVLQCTECGRSLDPEQQVIIKDSNGRARNHYHRECFRTLFK